MVAQLDLHVALEENPDQQLQNQQDDDPYEAEETLSLCDLPIYSDSAHRNEFSKEYQSSSFDRDEDNFFEFFSEEFTASTYASENKDIIFCGKKLIPYIKEVPHVAEEKKTIKKNTKTSNKSSTKKWGLFRWRRFRRSKSKVVTKYSKPSQVKDRRSNSISVPTSKSCKCDPSQWKVSVLPGNRSKSKWHLFLFGITKFPTEMELRDIRSRQSRRNPSTMFGIKCEASDEIMGKSTKEISSNTSSVSRAKGLWGLLRVMGCSSQHRNSLVL
ncbi:uncharacterized protein LOC126802595 [Argentina anserina]|uniref:uncharacterized protein LOC126802595 n=1 Tax=Argentina anserina TaxID=57926 RepID=UPI002176850E|nr:uncharacterized protein LOC126802595 [Potentilla anserina]